VTIFVFGSINLDLVTCVERFPKPGETVAGQSFAVHPGGKGANQALAAARAGAKVRMVGAVGRDAFADPALALLAAGGVDISGVRRVAGATGCATIMVDSAGENCIAVVAGANAHADPAGIADESLAPSTLLVLQQEVPAAANALLLARARLAGARTLLNAAPALPMSRSVVEGLDFLVINELEAATLGGTFGWPIAPEPFARAAVGSHAALTVVVTLGAQGALAARGREMWQVDAPAVDVVDTTGAGDAFVGALAAAFDRGDDLSEALGFGVAAGSLACTAHGAQSALPERAAIDALLRSVTLKASPIASH
jgi:ribokinase